MLIRDPISSLRRAARNSPWLVMSILAHTILLVILGLVVIRHQTKPPAEEKTIAILPHREVEPPEVFEPPAPTDRQLIPPDVKGQVVDVYVPTDLYQKPVAPEDPTKDFGDPNSIDPLADGGPLASTGIGVGTGQHRGRAPSAFTGRIDGKVRSGSRATRLSPGR